MTAVDERVADDERATALDPEDEIVRQPPGEHRDADRQDVPRSQHPSLFLETLEIIT